MRRATPRPDFDERPTLIRHAAASHHVWGDEQSGLVSDRVFLSTRALHVLEYQLSPGARFEHSPTNPTIFAADVLYVVLEGEMVIANPENGEVQPVSAGEAVLYHRDTWHHGFNPQRKQSLRVLEFLAPPPARGTTSGYARSQPYLETSIFRDERWHQRWPEAINEQRAIRTLHLVNRATMLWSFAGCSADHLIGTLVDTPFLKVVHGTIVSGNHDEFESIEHETAIYCSLGRLWCDIHEPQSDTFHVHTLGAGDVAYLPAGCQARCLVRDSETAEYYRAHGILMPDDWQP